MMQPGMAATVEIVTGRRRARVVVPGVSHHVTQRGNRRQQTFFQDADYLTWLQLAEEAFAEAEVEVWACGLMPNHAHLIAVPSTEQALARAVGTTHLRYTRRINARERWTGDLWQGRFASFPMDETCLRACARSVGLNPVRADPLLTAAPLADRLVAEMDRFFDLDVEAEAQRRLRRATSTGRPLGVADWIRALEASTGRSLSARPVGRPPGPPDDGLRHPRLNVIEVSAEPRRRLRARRHAGDRQAGGLSLHKARDAGGDRGAHFSGRDGRRNTRIGIPCPYPSGCIAPPDRNGGSADDAARHGRDRGDRHGTTAGYGRSAFSGRAGGGEGAVIKTKSDTVVSSGRQNNFKEISIIVMFAAVMTNSCNAQIGSDPMEEIYTSGVPSEWLCGPPENSFDSAVIRVPIDGNVDRSGVCHESSGVVSIFVDPFIGNLELLGGIDPPVWDNLRETQPAPTIDGILKLENSRERMAVRPFADYRSVEYSAAPGPMFACEDVCRFVYAGSGKIITLTWLSEDTPQDWKSIVTRSDDLLKLWGVFDAR